MIRPIHWLRVNYLGLASVLTPIVVGLILILVINQLAQTRRTNQELERQNQRLAEIAEQNHILLARLNRAVIELKKDSRDDHDSQLRYAKCAVALITAQRVVSDQELEDCLKGTRLEAGRGANSNITTKDTSNNSSPSPKANKKPSNPPKNNDDDDPPPPPPGLLERLERAPDNILDMLRS